jgi:hypothetical protein
MRSLVMSSRAVPSGSDGINRGAIKSHMSWLAGIGCPEAPMTEPNAMHSRNFATIRIDRSQELAIN